MGDRRGRRGGGAPRGPVLLVCEKCEHRLAKDGMFRQAQRVSEAIAVCQDEVRASPSGLRMLPVSCLDVCPRGAMAVGMGAPNGRGPAQTVVVRNAAELRAVCDQMMMETKPPVAEKSPGEAGEALA